MDSVTQRAAKALPGDAGRSVCRMGQATMDTLGVEPGDHLTLEGSSPTAANVWRLEDDEGDDIVRICNYIHDNAGVEVGDRVTVSRATPSRAAVVTIRFVETDEQGFEDDVSRWLTANLRSSPLSAGDVLPLRA